MKPHPQAALPVAPRQQVARRKKPSRRSALPGWLDGLKLIGERAGAALGDAYALAASSVLNELERFEDLNAERRFRQRSQAGAASRANVPRLAAQAKKPSPPAK
jgi:hypothetical protein